MGAITKQKQTWPHLCQCFLPYLHPPSKCQNSTPPATTTLNPFVTTKFFTNENENTLLQKIEGIFKHRNIHFFDALVGYFRASGYFRIRPFVEKAAQIRILVGINIDNLVAEAHTRGLLFDPNSERSQEDFFKEVKKNIQTAEYDKAVEEGMLQMIEDISTQKVLIRVHPRQNIHAKIYIFREPEKHDHGYGAVITGSSNLTDAGLSRNFEFNVELRENGDIEFATYTFEKLWEESVPVSMDYIEKLKTETFLNDAFTPYEVYLKFLTEYFGKNIDFDPNSVSDLPKGFKKLNYQADAVSDGFNKMMKHGGFFLADVVGLGKTVVGALIAKKFYFSNDFPSHRSCTLVITPPALEENWKETLEKFRLDGYDIITNGSLHKVRNPEKYDLIIVDEAHKFRSDQAEMYNLLQKLCKTPTRHTLTDGSRASKKVILISATPLNNAPQDIANLIYLFQDAKNSTLETSNLQHFFRQQIDAYQKLKKEQDHTKIKEGVKTIYDKIRVKAIEPLTVRRTRTDLKANEFYQNDLTEQGIHFPDVQKPEKIFYILDEALDALYDRTMRDLGPHSEGLTYNRYRAIQFLAPAKKTKYKNADLISGQLAKIMRVLLVKRIDSSFHAFVQSLRRFKEATDAMVKMFDAGNIYIAPNLPVNEYINDDKEEELIALIAKLSDTDPTIEVCTPDDFQEGFLAGLRHDQNILSSLLGEWQKVKTDPKLDEFVRYLNDRLFDKKINREGKLVVFSESKETTTYLQKELDKRGFDKVLCVDSNNRRDKMPIVLANFDANYKGSKSEDFDIVISTEVLAEGINLHRSNVIVNYDTPWNATRLMQRIGRVNRIGSLAAQVHVFNFFPTAKVDQHIELEKKAMMKLTAFHAALGEDSQIFSPDEEFTTFGLFDKDLDEEKDEKLTYLFEIRKIKEEEPEFFKKIKNMPLRARVGRKHKALRGATLTFVRSQHRDAFYFVREDGSMEEFTFLEAVRELYARPPEKAIPLHEHHHKQVQAAIAAFDAKVEAEKARDQKVDVTAGPNEKKALDYLEGFLSLLFISETEKALILQAKKAVRLARFQKLQREINTLQRSVKKSPLRPAALLDAMMNILNNYPLAEIEEATPTHLESVAQAAANQPDIIISESFNA